MAETPLNQRAQQILKNLVEQYIEGGQPVGSKALAERTQLDLSSATIRHVLAELEAQGYLRAPHTSAGRVPTEKGYRLFINNLLQIQTLNEETIHACQQRLDPNLDQKSLLQSATSVLSQMTKFAGIVTVARPHQSILRHVEFLSLSQRRILVVFVFGEKEVQNRIIHVDRHYSASELEHAANYLTERYAGKDLNTIRADLLAEMQTDREQVQGFMQDVEKAFREYDNDADYLVTGKTNLLELAKDAGVEKLQSLFDAFTQKRDMLHLLDKCLAADGVQIFIGEESGYAPLGDCSVVTAPYTMEGQTLGVLGVIGPTRMPYDYVISVVDVTSKLLSSALSR